MSAELIQPNLHVVAVHFPIALLAVGTMLEVFCFLGWRRSSVRSAGRWMILFGAMASAPVATTGIYALFDVRDSIPANERAQEVLREHILFSAVGSAAALAIVATWLGLGDCARRIAHWPLLILLLLSVTTILSAAHHGGELVYVHGVGVQSGADAGDTEGTTPSTHPAGLAGVSRAIAPVLPPLQIHLLLGGLAASLGVIAIGVASRAMIDRSQPLEPVERHDGDAIAAAFSKPLADVAFLEDRHTRAGPVVWLAVVTGLLASLSGWWFVAHDSDIWNLSELWKNVTDRSLNHGRMITRRTAHLVVGTTIVALPIVLLITSRYRPRARLIWLAASLLLLLAIAAQVWLGQLMLLDESRTMGPVTGWSAP